MICGVCLICNFQYIGQLIHEICEILDIYVFITKQERQTQHFQAVSTYLLILKYAKFMADLRTKLPLAPTVIPSKPKMKRVACSGDTPHFEA